MTAFLLAFLLTSTDVELDTDLERGARVAALADVLDMRLAFRSTRHRERPVHVGHCRRAPKGCRARLEAFATYFVEAGDAHGVDPWLLAAAALRESGMNPFAVGRAGEVGILQMHPRNKHARRLRFVRDPKYRKRCEREVGACQRELVDEAAGVMSRSIEICGDVETGLGMYNTGRCTDAVWYVRAVDAAHAKLEQIASRNTEA